MFTCSVKDMYDISKLVSCRYSHFSWVNAKECATNYNFVGIL